MEFPASENTHPSEQFILYEDDDILVVNKPAGMIAQDDSTGRTSLNALVKQHVEDKSPVSGLLFCAAIHRLDRPVSGVMLFAKTRIAAGRLSDDIRYGRMRKFYCALVNVPPGADVKSGWTDLNQHYVRRRDRAYIVDANVPGAVQVSLRYRFMGRAVTVLVELVTGKRHQIRVQLSSMGMPITGDRFYGSQESAGEGIIALHAHCLCFNHPATGRPMVIAAPIPQHMGSIMKVFPVPDDYPLHDAAK